MVQMKLKEIDQDGYDETIACYMLLNCKNVTILRRIHILKIIASILVINTCKFHKTYKQSKMKMINKKQSYLKHMIK